MKKEFTKIFQRNPEKLKEMFEMFKNKNSITSIARHFGVDRSSLHYHIKKAQLPKPPKSPKTKYQMEYPKNMNDKPLEDYYENGERINSGRSYKEYREIEEKRLREEFVRYCVEKQTSPH